MIRNVLDGIALRSRKSRLKRATMQAKRIQTKKNLRMEPLEDRKLLATLFWQGDDDALMSNPANWASDLAGTEAGVAPMSGDTLVFNRETVGITALTANSDVPDLTDLTIQHVANVASPTFGITGTEALGIVAISHTTSTDGGGFSIDAPLVLNADATFSTNLTSAPSFQNGIGYAESVSGAFSLTLEGNGHVLQPPFGGSFSFTGPLNVDGEFLDAGGPSPSVNVPIGATLLGLTNTSGPVDVATGGTVSPGYSPGIIATGDLNLADGANFDIEFDSLPGTVAGTNFDQIDVTGTVTVGNVNYNILPLDATLPNIGDRHTVINNDGGDDVVQGPNAPGNGTIVGVLNGVPMAIDYFGGDGNDVDLVAVEETDIFGFKFEDVNANGVYEPGTDQLLPGVTFFIDADGDGVLDPGETQTVSGPIDIDGVGGIVDEETSAFQFTVATGFDHQVLEVVAPPLGQTTFNPPPIFLPTGNDYASTLPLPDRQAGGNRFDDPDLAFGNAYEGAIYGFKFIDLDGDGVFDAGEPGLPNVTFVLGGINGQGDPVLASAVTDANGIFVFANLFPSVDGTPTPQLNVATGYTITEQMIPGFEPTTATVAANLDLLSREVLIYTGGIVQVNPPQFAVNGIDELVFGNTARGSIHAFKFLDADGNGVQDGGETGQELVDFVLTGTDGMGNPVGPVTMPTDVNGQVDFENLLPGNYRITETLPVGYVSSTPPIVRDFTITSGQELVWELGASSIPMPNIPGPPQPGPMFAGVGDQIGGAFDDVFAAQTFTANLTGELTEVEIPVDVTGVADAITMSVQTVNGFGEPSGTELGSVMIPAGTTGLAQTLTFDFSTSGINVATGVQYALVLQSPLTNFLAGNTIDWLGTIGGDPFPGGQVLESGNAGANWTAFPTDDHSFSTMIQPPADPRMEALRDTADANGLVFGNTPASSIHGFKFNDFDADGVFNNADTPQAGVEFTLTGTDSQGNLIDFATTTDMNGEFQFVDLFPSAGGYTVTETIPMGFVATTPFQRTFDLAAGIELVWQDGASDIDLIANPNDPRVEQLADLDLDPLFGEELMFGNVPAGSIHGFKFHDINNNGIYDPAPNAAGEVPQDGVTFTLTGTLTTGIVITPVVDITTVDGRFDFTGLLPGDYTVTETVPTGYVSTTPPLARDFTITNGQELVWEMGAANIPAPQPAAIDQQNPGPVIGANDVGGTVLSAQTFTPNVTGGLTQVDISINATAPVGAITLQVETLNGAGEPSGVALGIATVLGAAVPIGADQTLSFDFSGAPANLVAGQSYALVLMAPTTSNANLGWNDTSTSYAGGILFDSADAGATWAPFPGQDHIFTTTMLPAADPRMEDLVDPDASGFNEELMFGNTVYGSLHGFKFEDIDGNGIYDNTIDVPQADVTFQLSATLADGSEVNLQTTTGANGVFEFTSLPPSIAGVGAATGYLLVEAIPTGFTSTTGIVSFFDIASRQEIVWQAGASDVDPTNPAEQRVEVVDTQNRLLFGNTAPGSIHGFKFDDFNGDGVYNLADGDLPLANVEFTLEGTTGDGAAILQTQFTNANGEFWFVDLLPSIAGQPTLLPGINATGYTVTEVIPTGFISTTLPLARQFDLASRQELVWANGAAMLPAPPVAAQDQSQLLSDNQDVLTGVNFGAQALTPGTSGQLTQLQIQVDAVAGVGDVIMEIQTTNLVTGQPSGSVLGSVTIPAASVPLGLDQNLSFDFTGQSVSLVAGSSYAIVVSSPTSPAGSFSWNYTSANVYLPGESFLSGDSGATWLPFPGFDYFFATTMLTVADPRVEILADSNGDLVGDELMWGNTLPGEIHGYKFNDFDGDGIVDQGEPRLAGFTIQLRDALGNPVDDAFGNQIPDQVTDANGEYWFRNLLPGTYFVREVQQDGYVQTTHDPQPYVVTRGQVYVAQAGQGMLAPDDVRTEIVDKCLIFGNTIASSIIGYKFLDLDGNGTENGNDSRLAGIGITLTGDSDGDGNQDQLFTQTDATGVYRFENIRPGTYTITETPGPGQVATDGLSRVVNLGVGQILVAELALAPNPVPAVQTVVELAGLAFGNTYLGSIHGYKFEDVDRSGADNGEPRLSGVEITLLGNADGDVGNGNETLTALTDANGEFHFVNLYPGQYTITETVPPFATQTAPAAGFATITILSGQEAVAELGQATRYRPLGPGQSVLPPNTDLAFGNAYVGEIRGHKFEDFDADGIEDNNEPRLGGWQINLVNAQGDVAATTFTDANGNYAFTNLLPDTYFIRETQQTGYTQTTHDPQPITITGGQIYVAQRNQSMFADDPRTVIVDKCLSFGNTVQSSIHGFKFFDIDRSGILNGPPDLFQSGVTFTLTTSTGAPVIDASGIVVGNTTTDESGRFAFTNLLPGDYIVTEIVPDGQQPTTGIVARPFTLAYGEEIVSQTGEAQLAPGDPRFETLLDENSNAPFNLYWGNAPLLGAIHGHKFEDINGNGVEDAGDLRLNDWTIQITNLDGSQVVDAFGDIVTNQVTMDFDMNGDNVIQPNEQGLYWFDNLLPGTYLIREFDQQGWQQTTHNPQPITITGGQVYVAQLDQAMTNPALDPDDALTDAGYEEGREIIVDKCLSFGNQQRGELTWEKRTKSGLLGGVIFTLTRTHDFIPGTGFVNIVDVPIPVVDNLFPDLDPVFGQFNVTDLPLGRYTLAETIPVPGYDPDNTLVTFEFINDANRIQVSDYVWFNTWAKRAFVGSTFALRLDYLEQIGLAEAQLNQQQLNGAIGNPAALFGPANDEPFRTTVRVAESDNNVQMVHEASGIQVGEGEFSNSFDVLTTDLNERLIIEDLPRLAGSYTINSGGGDDVIDAMTLNFDSLDGGSGRDVLRLLQDGTISLAGRSIDGIEEVAVGNQNGRLLLSKSLIDAFNGDAPLTVRHDSIDQLDFDGSWELQRSVRENGEVVHVLASGGKTLHVASAHPWQNVLNRYDVSGDGRVAPVDALHGLNRLGQLTSQGSLRLEGEAAGETPSTYFDVNGDGQLTPLDILQVLNHLKDSSAEGEFAGVAADQQESAQDSAITALSIEEFDLAEEAIAAFGSSGQTSPVAVAALAAFDADEDEDDDLDATLAMLAGDLNR